MQARTFFGHPIGLSTLFVTETWERFSYYGLRSLLVLFATSALLDGGFGMTRSEASAIVGLYAASVYLACVPGGWIADRLIGLRRAILWGCVLISIGHVFLGIGSYLHERGPFFLGLVFVVMGTGLMKPNTSAIVGSLYEKGDVKRDAGFSIFYMGINIGSFFGQLATGFLGEKLGWHYGFGAAGVGMLIGLAVFMAFANRTLGSVGLQPPHAQRGLGLWLIIGLLAAAVLIVLVWTGTIAVGAETLIHYSTYVLLAVAVLYFAFIFAFGNLTKEEAKRVVVIAILFLAACVFWSAFEQAPTSLNLFARDFTNRNVFGWKVPAIWFQSINSFFVVALAPVFAVLWLRLGKHDLSATTKFGLGLLFNGIGFACMIWAAKLVISTGTSVSIWWLSASYFFQSVGELCLSPVGLSSMTKLAPARFSGQMMGIWFLADSTGSLIAGLVGGHVDPEKLDQMPRLFTTTTLSLLVASGALFALVPLVNRYLTPKT